MTMSTLALLCGCANDPSEVPCTIVIQCDQFSWNDIQELVSPYMDESAFADLVMQGLSSEYRISAAAEQAIENSQPDAVKALLNAIIAAKC